MSNKPLTNREKQFTVLPNETDPKTSFAVASQAVNKALAEIQRTRKLGNITR